MILYRGDAPDCEFLLTVHDDGTHELATRPAHSSFSWSPPVLLVPVPAEVCS